MKQRVALSVLPKSINRASTPGFSVRGADVSIKPGASAPGQDQKKIIIEPAKRAIAFTLDVSFESAATCSADLALTPHGIITEIQNIHPGLKKAIDCIAWRADDWFVLIERRVQHKRDRGEHVELLNQIV